MTNKPALKRTLLVHQTDAPAPKPNRPSAPRKPRKNKTKVSAVFLKYKWLMLGLEIAGLAVVAVIAIIVMLGYFGNLLSGTGFFAHLLPFAMSLLAFIFMASAALLSWLNLRKILNLKSPWLMPLLSLSFALIIGGFALQDQFSHSFGQFRTLVGGKQEAGRVTLSHQVYAAYRRYSSSQLHTLVSRAQPYETVIIAAAKAFNLDANLLQGVAATESSFLPRDSFDGGHGLFQITRVPKAVEDIAAKHLKLTKLSLDDAQHNTYLAAATLSYYLKEMHGDLFLGLLAYNIGPTNGGLRFIMQKYGVTDFITIQPYLQRLPRDYPIRVLSYALAFRLWQKTGNIPPYEKGKNALLIQRIGVPGLQKGL
ncbi:MAG: transglycosylase SLT domain-containing protein [Methylococcaceae bacterium]|nr:transglycosylase SLT domain-containing protein [Methylococcaceae bacterium]